MDKAHTRTIRRMSWATFLIGAACVAAGGPALAAPAAAAPKQLKLTSCTIEGVKEPARCGVYLVPEDRSKPNGRKLPLKVVVLKARAPTPGAAPVFYFEGGPGQSAVESASYVADLWINEHNDVVLVDQRGAGEGHSLDCALPGSDSNPQGYLESPSDALTACAATLATKADLRLYTTPVAMRDIDDVRRLLGYRQVNLYGASYGSRAAMIYTRMYGKAVRSLYISAVVPLELRMPLYFPWSAQRGLDEVFRSCARKPDCHQAFPAPAEDLAAILAALDKSPATVAYTDPKSGKTTNLTLGRWAFTQSLFMKLYTEPEKLPELLSQARRGEFAPILAGFIEHVQELRNTLHFGMNRALTCTEDAARIRPEEIDREAAGTFLGASMVSDMVESCKAWPKAQLPADYFAPFKSNVPTLMTSGTFDPVTPPRWAEVARKSFPNSMHIGIAAGHHFDEQGCLGKISSDFLARASVKGLDTTCIATSPDRLVLY